MPISRGLTWSRHAALPGGWGRSLDYAISRGWSCFVCQCSAVTDWLQDHAVVPFQTAMADVAVGAEVLSSEVLDHLSIAVEGLFRSPARDQYAGWPAGASTDGSSIHVCWRSGEASIEAVGLTTYDFGRDRFPIRLIVSGSDEGVHLAVSIGNANPETAEMTLVPETTALVPIRSARGLITDVEMIPGRRQIPISWTHALGYDVPAR